MSPETARLTQMANAVRALSMDAVQAADSGHPGMPMGMADVAAVLWSEHLIFDPAAPDWADRDRFVLSAGHGSMLIYALLHLSGYGRPTIDDIRNFRQLGSACAGHPENFLLDGVEATTGPLGQGLAMAVGMAIAERHLNATFGDDLVNHRSWTIAGDGCLMEGVNHEAAGLAGHLQLDRLVVLWDDNNITIDGPTNLSTSEDIPARYRAYGWHTVVCDGHDFDDIRRALGEATVADRPCLVQCRTVIGRGAPNKQGTAATHGSALGEAEVKAARETLKWDAPAFAIPAQVSKDWAATASRGQAAHRAWRQRLDESASSAEFVRRMEGVLPNLDRARATFDGWLDGSQKVATRKASEMALEALTSVVPEMIGGSADLTGSNNTRTAATRSFTATDRDGRYLYYGIREFGMAAAMNGMALHGGIIPYGGTFLIFSDYARNAIRLSALQRTRAIYVLTHDSIGLGEDGPTHQPIEQVMSLRLIPNLHVFRPADLIETAECWQLALQHDNTPSALCLTRQNVPQLRNRANSTGENMSAKGAYRLKAADAQRKVIFIATGSEVHLAMASAERLEAKGIGADVISMPCMELFEQQPDVYKQDLLPNVPPKDILRVSVEAGATLGWERYTMTNGLQIGIDRFGASAPGEVLFAHFGFTTDAIVSQVMNKING